MKRIHFVIGLIIFVFLATNLFAQSDLHTGRENAITNAIKIVSPAVASINVVAIQEYYSRSIFDDPLFNFMFGDQLHQRQVQNLGSGAVISADGYVVTNEHVIENAQKITVTLIGGEQYEAELVGLDHATDIALLKINSDHEFAFAQMGDSDDIIIGEWAIAIGNPFGLFSVGNKPTATAGIISGKDLNFGRQNSGRVYQNMIQTDASINTGNSGGPLVNSQGEIIGINTFIFTGGNYSNGSIGIGFAIPISRVKLIVEQLKRDGKIDRSFRTGLGVQNVDSFLAKYLSLNSTEGVIVTEVERKSAADKADIKVGDVIIEVNKRKVRNSNDIKAEIQENYLKAGDSIKLIVLRGKKEFETILTLE